MKLITPELEERFKQVGDQSEVENPIVVAKFFDPVGIETWYVTEYNAETKVCFGYVTGFAPYQWSYFSIEELESIEQFPTIIIDGEEHVSKVGIKIERATYFKETSFYDLFPEQKRLSELDINDKEKIQEQDQELEF